MNDTPSGLSAPIGARVPRPGIERFAAGRGRYVDDLVLPRMAHIAFLRSPFAHARIKSVDTAEAAAMPGVIRIFTAADLEGVVTPWEAVITNLPGIKSAHQHPLARDRATWQGECIAAVVAQSRAQAEDAVERIEVAWEELPPLTDMETALDVATPVLHPELGDNLCFRMDIDAGDATAKIAKADVVVEESFRINRQTAVPLEPRGLIADYNPGDGTLTVHHSSQVPHIMQAVFSRHFGLDEHKIRVIVPDVGGSFGLKIHVFGDEMTTIAVSKIMGRPIKFIADRLESFTGDIHCRDHIVKARIGLMADGKIVGLEVDDLTGIGPYSVYPRSSGVEAMLVAVFSGSPYDLRDYKATARVVFQNKTPMCQLRGVGMPIACSVTEGIVDLAARKAGLDPLAVRRKNVIPDDAYPYETAAGAPFEGLSLQASLEELARIMDYDALCADRDAKRKEGRYLGIGLSVYVEGTSPSPMIYGIGGAPITAQDACTVKLEPSGAISAAVGVTDQGQGAHAILTQVIAGAVGVPMESVSMTLGDTGRTPYGGGTWASRATGIAGAAALRAGRTLRENLLTIAGALMQVSANDLDIADGQIVQKSDGAARMSLAELGRIVHFQGTGLPIQDDPGVMATGHYSLRDAPFMYTNGAIGALVELDPDTGFITPLKVWAVDDCGLPVNPMLVDEQLRGGIANGIGSALFEELRYDEDGQLQNGTLVDYLLPMAGEMPDIEVSHVSTPTQKSELGAKGVGEAGVIGGPGAILNAVNDALAPFDVHVTEQPYTPRRILAALGRI